MPTYGRIPFLNRALASFLSQTYDDKELVIVNDDKNVEIKCEYANVTCINVSKRILTGQKKNLATNLGYHNLYIPFDDDDIMLPNRIQNCVDIHTNNPNVVLYRNKIGYLMDGPYFLQAPTGQNTISYTRKGWFECGGYLHNENTGEDQEFKNKIIKKYEIEDDRLIDYVYNFGGINYHLSCSNIENIEKIAYNQLIELNLLNKTYYIEPDWEEFNKFIELDNLYKLKKERIMVEHTSLGKIKIL
jgi:glycosyltransferase involved in cell wall biosynthesis